MVEADFIEGGGASVGGDVAADVVLDAIGAHDHGKSVPADEALDAALEFLIAGEKRFEAIGNRVGVRSVGGEWKINAGDSGVGAEALENFGWRLRVRWIRGANRGTRAILALPGRRARAAPVCACHYRWLRWSLQRSRCSRQLSRYS